MRNKLKKDVGRNELKKLVTLAETKRYERRTPMLNSRPSFWKNCVTCEYWAGPRKASTFRDRAEYNNDQDKGECVGGGWNKTQKTAIGTCNKWEKWSPLK